MLTVHTVLSKCISEQDNETARICTKASTICIELPLQANMHNYYLMPEYGNDGLGAGTVATSRNILFFSMEEV